MTNFDAATSVNRLAQLLDGDDLIPNLPLAQIDPDPNQPRRDWDTDERRAKIREMATSILAMGVIQPITVQRMPNGRYQIITGETRWRGSLEAGQTTIKAIVRKSVDQDQLSDEQIVENEVRDNLNPVELAIAVQARLDKGIPRDVLLQRYGWTTSKMSKRLSVLRFAPEVQEAARSGLVRDIDTLYALNQMDDGERRNQLHALALGNTDGAAVRAAATKKRKKRAAPRDQNIKALANRLSEELCTNVRLDHSKKGSGFIVIKYTSLDVLDGILQRCRLTDPNTLADPNNGTSG